MTQRRRALLSLNNERLVKLKDGIYTGPAYDYTILNNVVSLSTAGAVESNAVYIPFAKNIELMGNILVRFKLTGGSASWVTRTCNIFLQTLGNERIQLLDGSISVFDGLELTAVVPNEKTFYRICIRLRSQGVSYNPPLKFTLELYNDGKRVI